MPEVYREADLKDYSDAELISILKKSWEYSEDQPFEVMGRLTTNKSSEGIYFSSIEDLHSINDGTKLKYPLSETNVKHTVYLDGFTRKTLNKEDWNGRWVIARVELSSKMQREKHHNPFKLDVKKGKIKLLEEIPETADITDFTIDGKLHVEKWVYDFYFEKAQRKIASEIESYKERLSSEITDSESILNRIKIEYERLTTEITNDSKSLAKVSNELSIALALRDRTQSELKTLKDTMEYKLSTFKSFIENKARILVDLDLLAQEEVDNLLGNSANTNIENAYDFTKDFNSDLKLAVKYIQAYMYNVGIVYRRSLLEDFLAIVRTNDMIILAGDSGSGKTNLVKSFAQAIGGKAIIVPVKPNWTSAEDLIGYYNPLEKKYLTTPFLEALFEASRNPETPYFICLDEMNLARVEYYFADFLSLMEERSNDPEIYLYSEKEADHLVSEARTFLALIDEAQVAHEKTDKLTFLDILKDERINAKLNELCGFGEGDSLLKYHAQLRRLFSSYLSTPAKVRLPRNVRIIGTINVDETTHYLSPKILDRAHIIKFSSPLLSDWEEIESEITVFDLDLTWPVRLTPAELGTRKPYPEFDRNDMLVASLIAIVKECLDPLGVEFGLRTIRQARNYSAELKGFGYTDEQILNNVVLHKILPKLMFDGEKLISKEVTRKDVLKKLRDQLDIALKTIERRSDIESCVRELDRVIGNAEANDWVVNYWTR